jgi:hypothetical protein
LSFDCFSRIDKKSTSRRESCDDEENSQNWSFRCESESLKSFRFFSIDRVIWNASCRRNRFESRSKRARRTHTQFISSFNDSCESDSFLSFFDYWSESHRDRIALSSLKIRSELLSMMFICRSAAVQFIRASARSKWVYAFEISQNRCSVCSLLICILYEWCSTCLRFACDIWSESATDSNANRWRRRTSQFSKSRSKWFETTRKCFVNSDFVWLRVCWSFSIFYSWACVKRKRRKWESNEQRKCTAFESCEKSLFKWKSTISWKSWFVSSFFFEFFVRVNLISVVCRSARREHECRFSTESCSNRFWSWSSCRTSSNFWWNESVRIWLKRTRIHVESFIVRKACAFFRDFDNSRRCSFHKSIYWHHRRTRKISCSFRICCTFLINRHCKTDIKSKKAKNFARFRFASKTIRSFFDSLRKSWSDRIKNCWFNRWFSSKFFFYVVNQSDMWHRVKDVRYVQIQQNDHSIRFLFSYDVNLFDEKFQNRFNWSIFSTFHERVE